MARKLRSIVWMLCSVGQASRETCPSRSGRVPMPSPKTTLVMANCTSHLAKGHVRGHSVEAELVRGHSVEAELVALDVPHHQARLVDAIGRQ